MLTKWIWDRRLRPVLAGVLVLGLAIGLLASGLPAAQRSARIGEIAAEGLRPLSTLSLSLSRLGGEEVAALRENPADGAEFKTVSGLLTEVRQAWALSGSCSLPRRTIRPSPWRTASTGTQRLPGSPIWRRGQRRNCRWPTR